jgi:hypothetical protein
MNMHLLLGLLAWLRIWRILEILQCNNQTTNTKAYNLQYSTYLLNNFGMGSADLPFP